MDNLINLYENGIMMQTPKYRTGLSFDLPIEHILIIYPQIGCQVLVALVAVCCDHPALCKYVGLVIIARMKDFVPSVIFHIRICTQVQVCKTVRSHKH